ncbi:hypothetical protein ABIB51_000403 [Arthrobacter sp. UYCu712]
MALRRALIDLGMGLWLTDPPSRAVERPQRSEDERR